jgi:hypothetical protein
MKKLHYHKRDLLQSAHALLLRLYKAYPTYCRQHMHTKLLKDKTRLRRLGKFYNCLAVK